MSSLPPPPPPQTSPLTDPFPADGARRKYTPITPKSHLPDRNLAQVRARRSAGATLFICNLPEFINNVGLRRLFGPHGSVIDAFVPRRPNSKGKRFGFVRMRNSEVAAKTISSLNGTHMEGQKLLVCFAKNPLHRHQDTSTAQNDTSRFRVATQARDVKTVRECSGIFANRMAILFRWSVLAIAKSDMGLESISQQFISEGVANVSVHQLGNRAFLVSFADKDSLQIMEQSSWACLRKWFFYFDTNPAPYLSGGRFSWMSVQGLPPLLWSQETFSEVCGSDQSLVLIHPSSESGSILERAYLLTYSSSFESVHREASVHLNGNAYRVRFNEINCNTVPVAAEWSFSKASSAQTSNPSSPVAGTLAAGGSEETVGNNPPYHQCKLLSLMSEKEEASVSIKDGPNPNTMAHHSRFFNSSSNHNLPPLSLTKALSTTNIPHATPFTKPRKSKSLSFGGPFPPNFISLIKHHKKLKKFKRTHSKATHHSKTPRLPQPLGLPHPTSQTSLSPPSNHNDFTRTLEIFKSLGLDCEGSEDLILAELKEMN